MSASGSALGELPELGKTRGVRSARNRINFNDAIGNLLYDEDEPLPSKKTIENKKSRFVKPTKSNKAEDAEFYRQLSIDANTNLEEDEDSSVLAASVNIDDLEGNLFGSLSRKQKKLDTTKSDVPEKGNSKSTMAEAEKGNSKSTMAEAEKGNSKSTMAEAEKGNFAELIESESKCGPSILKSTAKPGMGEDDLLDLLGCQSEEDIMPSRKSKPKFTLTAKRTNQNDVAKGSSAQGSEETKANQEMLKLYDAPNKDEIQSSEFGHTSEGKPDEKQITKPDDIGHSGVAISMETDLLPMETINDNESMKGSRFDELLGVNDASGFVTRETKLLASSGKTATPMEFTGEEGYQFGKYRPSAISKPGSQKSKFIISRKVENEAPLLTPVTQAGSVEILDCNTLKPNRSLDDRVTYHSISEKDEHRIDTGEGRQQSILLHSAPGPFTKSINSDDVFAEGSEQHLGKVSQLQKQSKHPVSPWRDTVNSAVVKEQTTHKKESYDVELYEKRYKELERNLKMYQVKVMEMEDCFRGNEQTKQLAVEECTALKVKICELENINRKSKLDLQTQLDDLSMKLHRVIAERDELQISLDSCKRKQQEEMEAIQKEHSIRLRDVEESHQRRLARFQEDNESEQRLLNEKIVRLTREKNEQEVGFKKKMESLELMKNSEVSNMKESCRVLVEDLRREHELDIQHRTCLHLQEIETLRSSSSHSRALTELAQHVEASVKEVDLLHIKIDQAHSKELDQREQTIRVKQEHVKDMEERLIKQQLSNDLERDKLQKLIIKLEAHISQQSWQIEQERWQVQQEVAKLRAREVAFEDERSNALKGFRQGQEELQKAKETLLMEQKSILTQCFEEKRRLEAEKAEFLVTQRRATEQEQKDTEKYFTAEVNLSTAMAHLKDENSRICNQDAELKQQQERLKMERKAVNQEKEQLDALSKRLNQKLKEVEDIEQTALVAQEYGEKCLKDAQKYHSEIVRKTRILHLQTNELQRREQALSKERIALIRESRELQHVNAQTDTDTFMKNSSFEQSTLSLPFLSSNLSMLQPIASQDPKVCHYKSMHPSLTQLKSSIYARQTTWQAIKDKDEMEQEEEFLYSLPLLYDH